MSLLPGTRLGAYEVLGLVGAGGMGEVYTARDTRLQRRVAIKVIGENIAADDFIRRFESEALSASALNHPNIVTVYEFGVHDGLHYLVTEFIEGETLRQRLERGPLPIMEALDVAIQLSAALDVAHGEGLIHRDIKPENVMRRPDGYVKVLDFGLAKLLPTAKAVTENTTVSLRTTPGSLVGTVGYMSPEQVRGLDADQRADVWSVGVVLHEVISGRAPFAAPTSSDVIASVLERQPPPLTQPGVAIPPELERIVHKALEKDREGRYQTIRELLIDLRRLKQQLERKPGENQTTSVVPAARAPRIPLWALLGAAVVVGVFVVGPGRSLYVRPSHSTAANDAAAPAPSPRSVEYWLTVQRVRDGRPYRTQFASSGLEIFESGWKFQFNIRGREAGFFYLLNQGPGAESVPTLSLLYPTSPGGSSSVRAGEVEHTNWYVFDENPGTEQFWIVWSVRQIPELEAARRWVNPTDRGQVQDPAQAASLAKLLSSLASGVQVTADRATNRTVIQGRQDALASRADLKHQ